MNLLMTNRPTIADLAREAGVSVATVDRALNGRLPVRPETAERIFRAASAIDYHGAGLLRARLQQNLPQYRLGFLLLQPTQPFYAEFARELTAAAAEASGFRAQVYLDYLDGHTPSEIGSKLRAAAKTSQAIAMVAIDHPIVSAAVEALRDQGIPVFSLLSDFASGVRCCYIGVDNRKAGRTAGWAIAKTAPGPGKVAVFVGSHRFHGQELREIGLRSYFRENAPGFEVVETLISLETREIAHEATIDLLARYPDLVGIYVAGGGMEGVISALREENKAGRVALICNELTPDSRAAIAEEIVALAIATPLRRLARELVALMARAIEMGPVEVPGQIFLPFEIHVPESI